jgi:hypothetical protein
VSGGEGGKGIIVRETTSKKKKSGSGAAANIKMGEVRRVGEACP